MNALPAFLGPLAPLTIPPGTIPVTQPIPIGPLKPPVAPGLEPILSRPPFWKDGLQVLRLLPWGRTVRNSLAVAQTILRPATPARFEFGDLPGWGKAWCGSAQAGGGTFSSNVVWRPNPGTGNNCIDDQAINHPMITPVGFGDFAYWTDVGSHFEERFTHVITYINPGVFYGEPPPDLVKNIPARVGAIIEPAQPEVYKEPIPEPTLGPPTKYPPFTRFKPREPWSKERKFQVALPPGLGAVVGAVTEALDFAKCIHDALPYAAQAHPKWHPGNGDKPPTYGWGGGTPRPKGPGKSTPQGSGWWSAPTPLDWAEAIYNNFDQINWAQAFNCLVQNHFSDQAIGQLGQLMREGNRRKPGAGGFGLGPAFK